LVPYSRTSSSVPPVGVRLQRKRGRRLPDGINARTVHSSRNCQHFGFGGDEECLRAVECGQGTFVQATKAFLSFEMRIVGGAGIILAIRWSHHSSRLSPRPVAARSTTAAAGRGPVPRRMSQMSHSPIGAIISGKMAGRGPRLPARSRVTRKTPDRVLAFDFGIEVAHSRHLDATERPKYAGVRPTSTLGFEPSRLGNFHLNNSFISCAREERGLSVGVSKCVYRLSA